MTDPRFSISAWFPSCGVVLATAAPPMLALATITCTTNWDEQCAASLPEKSTRGVTVRLRRGSGRWRVFTPTVECSIVATVSGANVRLQVRGERVWRTVHLVLLGDFVVCILLSISWGELSLAPWIALALLLPSLAVMWYEAWRTAVRLRRVLPP